MLALIALAALVPLSQAETDKLGQSLIVQQACGKYLDEESRDYLVKQQLRLNKDNFEWLNGFYLGAASIKWPKVSYSFCKAKLPQAYKDLELIKRLQ